MLSSKTLGGATVGYLAGVGLCQQTLQLWWCQTRLSFIRSKNKPPLPKKISFKNPLWRVCRILNGNISVPHSNNILPPTLNVLMAFCAIVQCSVGIGQCTAVWVLVLLCKCCKCEFWFASVASVSFGAVKAGLYDAPGATKVTVAEEGRGTLAPSSVETLQKAPSVICTRTKLNKLASLKATLVRNSAQPATDWQG